MGRNAEFSVTIPIKINFTADSKIECDELLELIRKQILFATVNGDYETIENQMQIKKTVRYTPKEEALDKMKWEYILSGRGEEWERKHKKEWEKYYG